MTPMISRSSSAGSIVTNEARGEDMTRRRTSKAAKTRPCNLLYTTKSSNFDGGARDSVAVSADMKDFDRDQQLLGVVVSK